MALVPVMGPSILEATLGLRTVPATDRSLALLTQARLTEQVTALQPRLLTALLTHLEAMLPPQLLMLLDRPTLDQLTLPLPLLMLLDRLTLVPLMVSLPLQATAQHPPMVTRLTLPLQLLMDLPILPRLMVSLKLPATPQHTALLRLLTVRDTAPLRLLLTVRVTALLKLLLMVQLMVSLPLLLTVQHLPMVTRPTLSHQLLTDLPTPAQFMALLRLLTVHPTPARFMVLHPLLTARHPTVTWVMPLLRLLTV